MITSIILGITFAIIFIATLLLTRQNYLYSEYEDLVNLFMRMTLVCFISFIVSIFFI